MDNMIKLRSTINRRVAAKISRMTQEKAKELIASTPRGTIDQPVIRELTGGYVSQSLNAKVMRLLGVKAGYIKTQQPS